MVTATVEQVVRKYETSLTLLSFYFFGQAPALVSRRDDALSMRPRFHAFLQTNQNDSLFYGAEQTLIHSADSNTQACRLLFPQAVTVLSG